VDDTLFYFGIFGLLVLLIRLFVRFNLSFLLLIIIYLVRCLLAVVIIFLEKIVNLYGDVVGILVAITRVIRNMTLYAFLKIINIYANL
jgi:hypothetical protein